MENDTLQKPSEYSAPPRNHLLKHSLWHIRGYAPVYANQPRYANNLDRVSVALALFSFGRANRGYLSEENALFPGHSLWSDYPHRDRVKSTEHFESTCGLN